MRKLIFGAFFILVLGFSIATQAQETMTISTAENDAVGEFLVDADGNTLYIFTNDTPNTSNCSGDCLGAWPAVTVSSMDSDITLNGLSANFGVIEREDTGELQLTYNRAPLYYFANDAVAGDVNGEGLGDVWFVARPQVLSLSSNEDLGSFLTDTDGNTVYIFTVDDEGVSNCTGDCLAAWPALTVNNENELFAGYNVVAQDDLGTILRADTGELQVTYQGQPLYYFSSDASAGDVTGQAVGDVWFVVNPSPISVASVEGMGDVLVGRDGTTLYTFTNDTEGVSTCTEVCAVFWPPLTVESDLELSNLSEDMLASITLVEHPEGGLQVVYNGQPLYYYISDAVAGDTTGEGVGDVWFVATSMMSAMAEESSSECRVSPANNVNLRSGPGTFYGIAGSLLSTDNALVIGQAVGTDGFVWWQIESSAWVRSDLVTTEGNCDSVATVVAPPPPPTAVPAPPTAEPQQTQPEQPQQPEQPANPPPPQTTEES